MVPSLAENFETKEDQQLARKNWAAQLEACNELVATLTNLAGQIMSKKKPQDRRDETAQVKKRDANEKNRVKAKEEEERKRKAGTDAALRPRGVDAKKQKPANRPIG